MNNLSEILSHALAGSAENVKPSSMAKMYSCARPVRFYTSFPLGT